jgi:N4-(beta-N-acetylglucosaminyl)-L-asparaginase
MRAAALLALASAAAAAAAHPHPPPASLPLIIHTWPWRLAADAGYAVLAAEGGGGSPLDAVQAAAAAAEAARCDGTVGPGGSPDEGGETTLDAVLMDGATMAAGGVGDLRRVASAVGAARLVLDTTTHTLLAGGSATAFAAALGAPLTNLSSPASVAAWRAWREGGCQPNFRTGGVTPDPRTACGPYRLAAQSGGPSSAPPPRPTRRSHDTIAAVAVAASGAVAAGASSNGAAHKVPGRVGDAAVPGGGAYASAAAGCGSTGDGDVHLRYLPCAVAVALVEHGLSPQAAADAAVHRIAAREPGYRGAVVVADAGGRVGAAAAGWAFQYTVASRATGGEAVVVSVAPVEAAGGVAAA